MKCGSACVRPLVTAPPFFVTFFLRGAPANVLVEIRRVGALVVGCCRLE